jgi:phosphatidylinositol 4-kinase A
VKHSGKLLIGVKESRLTLGSHVDSFYLKEEFAPSDKSVLLKRQQAAHNLIAPHLRILRFLASHFNATRLGSIHTQRICYRLATITLQGLKTSKAHPLAREMHFQTVLFGLNVLRYCPGLDRAAQWRLKDIILSGGLAWFSYPPR